MKLKNNNGAALITTYFVITTLITLSVALVFSSVNELNLASRNRDATQAFWLAEAGIHEFVTDTSMLDDGKPGVSCDETTQICTKTIVVAGTDITLEKQDTPTVRYVVSSAQVRGSQRSLQVEFQKKPPSVFDNTISSGGNIILSGIFADLDAYGKTRITGSFQESGFGASGWFEDKQEGIDSGLTTLTYPDANNNGTSDEFSDFVEQNRTLASTYPPEEVVYIQSDDTQTVVPNSQLIDKKIIFVEGSTPGTGNVNVVFNATWQDNQNVTIISTGDVNYIQPLTVGSNSQLNIIAWNKYYEPSILYSTHNGIIYSHGVANFFEILDFSTSQGAVVANQELTADEVLAHKEFHYVNPVEDDGTVPPGFEGLIGDSSGAGSPYVDTPSAWGEI